MALFHLHLRFAGESIPDSEGIELETADEARTEAVRMFRELLLDQSGEFWHSTLLTIEVTDVREDLLFTLSFAAQAAKGPTSLTETPPRWAPWPMSRR